MSDQRPRFRQDLVAELIEEQAGRFIDVMDPDSGNVFRFYEVEFSLACGMDGERDVAGIVKWAKDELGLAPSPNEVQKVIATLGDLGYLDRGAEARAAVAAAVAEPPRPELAQGIVVGAKPVAAQQSAVELGIPGTRPAAGPDMPSVPDIALGAPGTGPTPRVDMPVEDVPLGQAGRGEPPRPVKQVSTDLSMDLADQMTIRPDDVKEAVRQSKVMQAVEVPPELLETRQPSPVLRPPAEPQRPKQPQAEPPHNVTRPGTPPPIAVPTAPRAPTPLPFEAAKPASGPSGPPSGPSLSGPPIDVEVKPPPVAEVKPPQPQKPPVELKPPVADKPITKPPAENKPIAPPAPEAKTSKVLIVLLILVLVGGGTFAAWWWLIRKTDEEAPAKPTGTTQPIKKDPDPPKEPDKKAPPPPAVKLALVPGAAAEVKGTGVNAGLEFIEVAKPVKEGDVIARYFGAAGPTQAFKDAKTRETKAQAEVDAATAAVQKAKDDKAPEPKVKEAEEALAAKQKALDARKTEATKAKEEYAKVVLTAPIEGELKPVAKTGTKLAADAVIATVTPATTLVATFPAAEGVAAGSSVYVNVKKPEAKLTCKVLAADNAGVKVSCPAKDDDSQKLADAEVALGGPASDEPAPAAGSGSGSAATGSGSAAKPKTPGNGAGGDVQLKQFPKDPPKDPPKDTPKDPPKDPPAGSN